MRCLRHLAFVAVLLVGLLPDAARAAAECSFDGPSHTITVTAVGAGVVHRSPSGAIEVDGVDCGGTVTDTDLVVFSETASSSVTIDLTGGPFAPGFTDEGDGSSEVEFVLDGQASLAVTGSSGPDAIAVGSNVDMPYGPLNRGDAVNLNDDETTPDVDVFAAARMGFLDVNLGDGDDRFTGAGVAGSPPYDTDPMFVTGGEGDDTIAAGLTHASFYLGGPGTDTADYGWLAKSCFAEDVARSGLIDCGTAVTFTSAGFERRLGHAGVDWLGGEPGPDLVLGRGGDDQLWASAGADVLRGGHGRDMVVFIHRRGVTADLAAGTATYARDPHRRSPGSRTRTAPRTPTSCEARVLRTRSVAMPATTPCSAAPGSTSSKAGTASTAAPPAHREPAKRSPVARCDLAAEHPAAAGRPVHQHGLRPQFISGHGAEMPGVRRGTLEVAFYPELVEPQAALAHDVRPAPLAGA